MTARIRTAPAAMLREISDALSAPLPRRTALLRELAYDLEELTGRFVAEGLSYDEASRRAREALMPDRETLAQLDRVHAPRYRRLTARVGDARLLSVERAFAVVAVAGLLAGEMAALARVDLFESPSHFLWPVLVLGSSLLVALGVKAFELWVKGDHSRTRAGLGMITGLAVATLGVAFAGAMVDTLVMTGALEREPARAAELVYGWLIRDATLLAVGLVFALAGGLGRLVTTHWIAFVESEHERATHLTTTS